MAAVRIGSMAYVFKRTSNKLWKLVRKICYGGTVLKLYATNYIYTESVLK
jgi:hypothetical protein